MGINASGNRSPYRSSPFISDIRPPKEPMGIDARTVIQLHSTHFSKDDFVKTQTITSSPNDIPALKPRWSTTSLFFGNDKKKHSLADVLRELKEQQDKDSDEALGITDKVKEAARRELEQETNEHDKHLKADEQLGTKVAQKKKKKRTYNSAVAADLHEEKVSEAGSVEAAVPAKNRASRQQLRNRIEIPDIEPYLIRRWPINNNMYGQIDSLTTMYPDDNWKPTEWELTGLDLLSCMRGKPAVNRDNLGILEHDLNAYVRDPYGPSIDAEAYSRDGYSLADICSQLVRKKLLSKIPNDSQHKGHITEGGMIAIGSLLDKLCRRGLLLRVQDPRSPFRTNYYFLFEDTAEALKERLGGEQEISKAEVLLEEIDLTPLVKPLLHFIESVPPGAEHPARWFTELSHQDKKRLQPWINNLVFVAVQDHELEAVLGNKTFPKTLKEDGEIKNFIFDLLTEELPGSMNSLGDAIVGLKQATDGLDSHESEHFRMDVDKLFQAAQKAGLIEKSNSENRVLAEVS